jgi:signal transduction histidine kinase
MDTFYATPERTDDTELAVEIEAVSQSSVVSGLLKSVAGLLAIIDENRQIVALNDSFLKLLGIDDPGATLGLRPGEALQCVHADDGPAGCGTTEYCSTCGAAISIVTSLGKDRPSERLCALSTLKDGHPFDMALLVRSQPITVESKKYLLLFLQDITRQEQRAALERTFYHDINNMLSMLVPASDMLVEDDSSELAATIRQAAFRLHREVAIQRALSEDPLESYQPMWDEFTTDSVFNELISFFKNHPSALEKHLDIPDSHPTVRIKTDICLLLRVLCNMIINALEATEKGDAVRVWSEHGDGWLSFSIWNSRKIPPEVSKRIFQRNLVFYRVSEGC